MYKLPPPCRPPRSPDETVEARPGKGMHSKTIMKEIHRSAVAAYVASQRHLRGDLRGAKTLTQMAKEIGTTKTTVRRWLRRDHWALWMGHWASAEEIWEAAQRDRQRLPQRERQARQLAAEQCRAMMVAHLDGCLADLTSGAQSQCIE